MLDTAGIPLGLPGIEAENIGEQRKHILVAVDNLNCHLMAGDGERHPAPKSVMQ
jgi:hypothetical protein